MSRKKWGLVLVVLFLSFTRLKAEMTLQQVLDNIKKQEQTTQAIEFQLEQVIKIKMTKDKQVMKGKIFFKKPDFLRVEYSQPRPQIILSDGKNLAVYTRDGRDWTLSLQEKIDKLLPSSQVSNYGLWTTEYLAQSFNLGLEPLRTRTGQYILVLTPKEKLGYEFTLKLEIDPERWIPLAARWEDENSEVVTKLNRIKINSKFKEELFKKP